MRSNRKALSIVVVSVLVVAAAIGWAYHRRFQTVQLIEPDLVGPGRSLVQGDDVWPEYVADTWHPIEKVSPSFAPGSYAIKQITVPGTDGKPSTIFADFAGRFHGPYILWYGTGPFRGLKAAEFPFRDGILVGAVTYWNNEGRVLAQFNPNSEKKTAPPWWDGVTDQIPKDGIYTAVGGGPLYKVHSQWKYQGGKKASELRKPPWEMPSDGFWKTHHGKIVELAGLDKSQFWLNSRPIHKDDILLLKPTGQKEKRVRFALERVQFPTGTEELPAVAFIEADPTINVTEGQVVSYSDLRAPLSWP
jgi:hypothetical protein